MATHVERSIEVAVPVRTAYDQWTQFEDFPRFMAGVQQVRQIGDALTHWVAEIGGIRREWDAAILEQVPDQKVAWAATTGATNAGAVYFTAVGADRTRVLLTLDYEPEGIVEKIGDVLDVIDRQAVADLDRFKEYIEKRGAATGGWRGRVDDGDVQGGAAPGAAAGGHGGTGAAGVQGDLVSVGPTGGTHSTLQTEPGPARVDAVDDEGAEVGHSGDPIAVDAQRSTLRTDSSGSSGRTGSAGAGPSTGPGGDDSSSGLLTGYPGARTSGQAGSSAEGGAGGSGTWTDPVGPDDQAASGVGERTVTEDEPAQRDFTNRNIAQEGVQRDFANREITQQDVANRGVETGTGRARPDGESTPLTAHATRSGPTTLDALDAPGPGDEVGASLDPLDPRAGTADDPDNPQRPSV